MAQLNKNAKSVYVKDINITGKVVGFGETSRFPNYNNAPECYIIVDTDGDRYPVAVNDCEVVEEYK